MQTLYFFLAFVAVLALIGIAAWLVRRFASNRLGGSTQRGRMPRLAVIDAAAVDGRRRLVLVRRDNVEHLLMIGGPSDIVVEPNIVRAAPAREQLPQRPGPAAVDVAPPPRVAPLPDAWSEQDEPAEPAMEPPPRPSRPSFVDEVRRPAAERREDRRDPMAGFALEPLNARPEPRLERPEPRVERPEPRAERPEPPIPPRVPRSEQPPLPRAPRPSEPPKPTPRSERSAPLPPSADQNLAEMAQRLEAALRRPGAPAPAAEVAPPVAPEPPARPAARSEPPAPPAATPAPQPTPAANAFDSLEDEMASLLGRSKSSS